MQSIAAQDPTRCSDLVRADDRFREGFRTPAEHEWLTQCWGRRPKASEERTRGTAASSLPSMGIWSCRGVGRGWFWGDWRELKAADGSGLGLASIAERLLAV